MNKKGIAAIINKLLCVFLALFMIVSLMPKMVLADDPEPGTDPASAIVLELDSSFTATVPGGASLFYTFSLDSSLTSNYVCGFNVNPNDDIVSYLYDQNMVLLKDSEGQDERDDQQLSYCILLGKTYFLEVRNNNLSAAEVTITASKLFELSTSMRIPAANERVLYENQAVIKEEIYEGELVSYMWYDWDPILQVYIKPLGWLKGTFSDISESVFTSYGVHLDYSIEYTDSGGLAYQSYEKQWYPGVSNARARIHFYDRNASYALTIKEGPIDSLEINDTTYVVGAGTSETVIGEQGEAHTFMHYDAMPHHMTVHTVDDEYISGSPQEITDQLFSTYNVRFTTELEGDDQSYLNEWGEEPHEMTFSIGNVSASYTAYGLPPVTNPMSGTCGDNLEWALDENGELTVIGTGSMYAYNAGTAPWYIYRSVINSLVIEEDATRISSNAFYGCASMESVAIPVSIKNIDTSAFARCDSISAVYYSGTVEEWKQITIETGNDCLTNNLIRHSGEHSGKNVDGQCQHVCELCGEVMLVRTEVAVDVCEMTEAYECWKCTDCEEDIFDNFDDAAVALRLAIIGRQSTFTLSWFFDYTGDPDNITTITDDVVRQAGQIIDKSYAYSMNPYGGVLLDHDTNAHQNWRSARYFLVGDRYVGRTPITIYYQLSDEQDQAFKNKSDEVINSFDLVGKSDYEKTLMVYEYVTSHVTYDYEDAEHNNHPLSHTAYGALVDELAVCEGIAYLMYHLLLRLGIECRYIEGDAFEYDGQITEAHAWNLVKLGDYYYCLDATWDLNKTPERFSYFLLCQYCFEHLNTGDIRHTTITGDYQLPMSLTNYGNDLWIEEGNNYEIVLDAGDSQTLVFEASKTGWYTFTTSDSSKPVHVSFSPYFYRETIRGEESYVDDEISNAYRLQKGHRYILDISLEDSSQTDTFSVSMTKNYVEPRTIESVSLEPLFYYTGTGKRKQITSTSTDDRFEYMYYDITPKDMVVTLDDGTVLQGTFDEVLYELDEVYEIQPEYAFTGNDQSYDTPWGTGIHNTTLFFDGFTLDYHVEIAENPFESVEIDISSMAYDDEYNRYSNGTAYYDLDINNIIVTTADQIYQGDYDSVYQEICEDYPFDFEYLPTITQSFRKGTNYVGTYTFPVTLFGVDLSFDFEIRYNPITRIVATDRIVTEDDQYTASETVLDEYGQEQTVSYMAYSHEPASVRVFLKDNTNFTGTVDEVMTYLSENYDYHEEFFYENTDSYNDHWGIGAHQVTICIRNASATYNVMVQKSEMIPLEIDTEYVTVISGNGSSEVFSLSASSSAIYGFTMDLPDGVMAYLYNDQMMLLTDSDELAVSQDFMMSYYIPAGKTYYLEIRNYNSSEEVTLTPVKLIGFSTTLSNVNRTLYENQAVLKETIIDGELVSYEWYDWNPTIRINSKLQGTLDNISENLYEQYGVHLKYSIEYINDGTPRGKINLYSDSRNYSLTINPGPVLSMDIDDITYAEGNGTIETVVDDQGVEHTYLHYDAMPQHLTAHTVDGDISGTPEEIVNHIHDTYGIVLDTMIDGDDQDYLNPWNTGTHGMTFSIGNVSAPYNITIESLSKAYIPLGAVGGDLGYYVRPATEGGLNGKNYEALKDNSGYYYEIADGDMVYFRVDVKKGYDASGLSVTFNGSPVTLYTADGLMAACDVEFTPATEDGISTSRYFVLNVGEDGNFLVSGVGIARLQGEAQIYGGSLTLDGEIGVNIYVTIPDEVFADAGAYAMVNDKKVLLSGVPYQTSGGMKLYKFSYFLQSTQMNDAVVLRLYGSDDSLITLYSFAGEEITENGYSYSVRDYINRVTASYTQSPKLKALVNALSDYGSLAQVQFGYHADQAAAIVEQEALDAVTLETLEPLAYTTEGTLPEGLGYYGSNLVLDSKTTLKHYFTLGSGHDISEYRFTVGGEEYTPARAGAYYYVEIPNITAKDLDERYPVRITPAGDDTAYYELSYSALSYARQVMIHSSDNNLRQLVKGLYLYSLAAEAFFDR